MNDETNNKVEQTGEPTPQKDKSVVEIAQELRDEIRQEREKLTAEREALQKIQAEALLSGTSGGRVETKPKEQTAKEYADSIMNNTVPIKND